VSVYQEVHATQNKAFGSTVQSSHSVSRQLKIDSHFVKVLFTVPWMFCFLCILLVPLKHELNPFRSSVTSILTFTRIGSWSTVWTGELQIDAHKIEMKIII
jgi:hypothetical protein